MIFDCSCARVVLINWKSENLAYFAAILLLCGDISQNPGPSIDFPCRVCALGVSDSDAAVCCDYCDCWYMFRVIHRYPWRITVTWYLTHQQTLGFVSIAKNPSWNMYLNQVVEGSETIKKSRR